MMDEKTYDEIDRYLRGEMSAEERASFDARLSSDETLRAEVAWLSAAFQSAGKMMLKTQVAEIFAAVPLSSLAKYTPSVPAKSFLKKWWWAVAVVVAAAAAIVWWSLPKNGEERAPQEPPQDTATAPQPYDPPAAAQAPASGRSDSEKTVTKTTTTTIQRDTILPNGEIRSTKTVKKDSVRVIKETHYESRKK